MDYRFENVNESENENQGYQPQYSYQPQPDTAPEAPQKPKKNRTGAKVTALVLSCALVGGAMGFGGSALQNHLAAKNADTEEAQQASVVYEGSRETSVINIAQIDTSKEMTPAEVYAQNVNSTVGIRTSITTNYWGYQTQAAAAGSGFILSADGYILTNYHVVEDSNSITVSLYDGTEYDATLVNREVTLSSNVTMNLIQTDCAINSGNSGGALFNLYGEVIGITNAKYSSSSSSSEASIDNIGFAIPLNHVKNIVKSIIETGSITKPYIGVTVSSVSSEAQGYGLPTGAAVRSVEADSPAAKAGLEENDIITEVDGTAINSSTELVNYVGEKTPGDELTFKVYRQGEELELTVTIGEKTQSAMPTTTTDDAQQSQQSQGQSQQGGQLFPWGFGFGY